MSVFKIIFFTFLLNGLKADEGFPHYGACSYYNLLIECEDGSYSPKVIDEKKLRYLSQISYFSELKQQFIKLADDNLVTIDRYLECYKTLDRTPYNKDCLVFTSELEDKLVESLFTIRTSLAMLNVDNFSSSQYGKLKLDGSIAHLKTKDEYPLDSLSGNELKYVTDIYARAFNNDILHEDFKGDDKYFVLFLKRSNDFEKIQAKKHSAEKEKELLDNTDNFYHKKMAQAYSRFSRQEANRIKDSFADIYKKKYHKALEGFSFALYFKKSTPSGNDITNALRKRKKELTEIRRKAALVSVYSKDRLNFLTNEPIIESFLMQNPEYCKIANQVKSNAHFKQKLDYLPLLAFCGLTGVAPCLAGGVTFEVIDDIKNRSHDLEYRKQFSGNLADYDQKFITHDDYNEILSKREKKVKVAAVSLLSAYPILKAGKFVSSYIVKKFKRLLNSKYIEEVKGTRLKRLLVKTRKEDQVLDDKKKSFLSKINVFKVYSNFIRKFGNKLTIKLLGKNKVFTLPISLPISMYVLTIPFQMQYDWAMGVKSENQERDQLEDYESDYRYSIIKETQDECLEDTNNDLSKCLSKKNLLISIGSLGDALKAYDDIVSKYKTTGRSLNSPKLLKELMKDDQVSQYLYDIFFRLRYYSTPEFWEDVGQKDRVLNDKDLAQITYHYHQLYTLYKYIDAATIDEILGPIDQLKGAPQVYNLLNSEKARQLIEVWKKTKNRKLSELKYYLMMVADNNAMALDYKYLNI